MRRSARLRSRMEALIAVRACWHGRWVNVILRLVDVINGSSGALSYLLVKTLVSREVCQCKLKLSAVTGEKLLVIGAG